jgi:hypothetical protein
MMMTGNLSSDKNLKKRIFYYKCLIVIFICGEGALARCANWDIMK